MFAFKYDRVENKLGTKLAYLIHLDCPMDVNDTN